MEQILSYTLMLFIIILGIYVTAKLTLRRYKKAKKKVGIVVSKSSSFADDFSLSKGYMDSKNLYIVKIKCENKESQFKTSQTMYELLILNQEIEFEYIDDTLYNFKAIK